MDEGRAGITGCLAETDPTIVAYTPPRGNVVSRRARDAMQRSDLLLKQSSPPKRGGTGFQAGNWRPCERKCGTTARGRGIGSYPEIRRGRYDRYPDDSRSALGDVTTLLTIGKDTTKN